MDLSLFRHRLDQFKNLFESFSNFKTYHSKSKTNPEIIKIGRGIALLIIALLCAWIANTASGLNARQQTLQNEWPSIQVWHGILKQGGWTRTHQMDLSTLLKNHPDPFSNESIVWETEDHCLIFLSQSPYQNDHSDPELWSCATSQNKPPRKVKWHKIGSGYSGLNLLAQIPIQTAKKAASYIDPREIRY